MKKKHHVSSGKPKRSSFKVLVAASILFGLIFFGLTKFPKYYLDGKTKKYAIATLKNSLYEHIDITREEEKTYSHVSAFPMSVTKDIFYFLAVKEGRRVKGRFTCPRIILNLYSCQRHTLEIFQSP